jgi:hypothetical protein
VTPAPAFVVGTGRCGTHLVAELLDREPSVVARHEADPLADAFARWCAWRRLPFDAGGLVARKRRAIESAGAVYVEASAYLSLSSAPLADAFDSRFVALVRDPADTVNSLWVKGWYDPDRPPIELHHPYSRLTPRGDELERWQALTRIGKLAWFWRSLNERMLAELDLLPRERRLVLCLEELDYRTYWRLATFVGIAPALSPAAFAAVCARRPGAGPTHRDVSSWSRVERAEFRAEVGELAERLGYASDSRRPRPRRLRRLFLVDVKPRLINNTPYDVYRLADRFAGEPREVIDLRFHEDADLPESDSVHLFLETAGTWMCFDWDPARFVRRIDSLLGRYPRVTVVGPQARALRELTGASFEVVDTVHFAAERDRVVSGSWLAAACDERYNGQWFDGERLRLVPTLSISHTMSCPLRCSFCYYAEALAGPRPDFSQTLAELERASRHGHRNFYFMDPNFLRSAAELDRLRELYERLGRGFAYYCQVSPNFLTEARLERLAASGCGGMVVGIENRAQIVAKGSVEEARERVERVVEHGMMPTLFFMVDGSDDVEELVEEFAGIPFRYTVLNNAFAGDRSLGSVEAGFHEKRRLAELHRDVIAQLQERPDFLGPRAVQPVELVG